VPPNTIRRAKAPTQFQSGSRRTPNARAVDESDGGAVAKFVRAGGAHQVGGIREDLPGARSPCRAAPSSFRMSA